MKKFRAWDAYNNVMFFPNVLEWHEDGIRATKSYGGIGGYLDNPPLMRFTGHQDAVGTDIYEHDILLTDDDYCLIEWKKPQYTQCYRFCDGYDDFYGGFGYEHAKVVGNKYQNPELVSKEGER